MMRDHLMGFPPVLDNIEPPVVWTPRRTKVAPKGKRDPTFEEWIDDMLRTGMSKPTARMAAYDPNTDIYKEVAQAMLPAAQPAHAHWISGYQPSYGTMTIHRRLRPDGSYDMLVGADSHPTTRFSATAYLNEGIQWYGLLGEEHRGCWREDEPPMCVPLVFRRKGEMSFLNFIPMTRSGAPWVVGRFEWFDFQGER